MRGGRRAAEGPGGTEVATAANINSTRPTAGGDMTEGSEAARPENVRAHVYIKARTHQAHKSRGPGRRIHCGVEVTVLSTNKMY